MSTRTSGCPEERTACGRAEPIIVNIDETKAQALDRLIEAYVTELRAANDNAAAVTLSYGQSVHRSWRTILRMLPVSPKWEVLDVGSGLGILGIELAANVPARIVGVELKPEFVEHARRLQGRFSELGLLTAGSSLQFEVGDAQSLPLGHERFDLVFMREVLQFLPDPLVALGEVFRVLRPGAYFCLSDTDDQLRITWPAPSEALERLVAAVAQVQHDRGGDRQAGRKLSSYLRCAGFEIASVVVLPEAQHRLVDPSDAERALILEQLHAARHRVVSAGVIDPARFDTDLATVEHEAPYEEFRLNGRIIAVGRRP